MSKINLTIIGSNSDLIKPLIKRGNQIMLYNPKLAKIPGVNPIILSSLKDYEEYVKWQRASKVNCPILHLERMFDTQGNAKYEIKNSFLLDLMCLFYHLLIVRLF